jgi:hypothetical protein
MFRKDEKYTFKGEREHVIDHLLSGSPLSKAITTAFIYICNQGSSFESFGCVSISQNILLRENPMKRNGKRIWQVHEIVLVP